MNYDQFLKQVAEAKKTTGEALTEKYGDMLQDCFYTGDSVEETLEFLAADDEEYSEEYAAQRRSNLED